MKKRKLPAPNVSYLRPDSFHNIDEKALRGMICNPIYAGIASFPKMVDDEAWIKAASQFIAEEGVEQFLVNMLYVLRQSLQEEQEELEEKRAPYQDEDENFFIYCSHDGLPMVALRDDFACVGEYLFEHLEWSTVQDLISQPVLTLVFRNGHTLPLLCPDCGQSFHADEDQLLQALSGLSLIDIEWDYENEVLLLYFGQLPEVVEDLAALDEIPAREVLEVHLNVVYGLTCPGYQDD